MGRHGRKRAVTWYGWHGGLQQGDDGAGNVVLSIEFFYTWGGSEYRNTFQFGAAGGIPRGRGEQVECLQKLLVLFTFFNSPFDFTYNTIDMAFWVQLYSCPVCSYVC